ncbi:MAG: hypothetical protein VX583_15085 [Bdellovibrionota bacterium]
MFHLVGRMFKVFSCFVFLLMALPSYAQFKCSTTANNVVTEGELVLGETRLPIKTENLLARLYPQYAGLSLKVSSLLPRLSRFEVVGEHTDPIFEAYFFQFMETGKLELREYNALTGPSGKNYLEVFNSYYENSFLDLKLNVTQKKLSLRPQIKIESLFTEEISDYFAQISNEIYISEGSLVLHRRAELSFDNKFLDVYYVLPKSAVDLALEKNTASSILGEVIFFEKGLDEGQSFRFFARGQIKADLKPPANL